jgi:Holliday junction resolvase
VTRYSSGADFERAVKKDLQAHGWLVTRAAGSHGAWDLKAVAPGPTVALVQCKRDGKMSKDDMSGLRLMALAFNCIPILAYRDDGVCYSELFADRIMDWHPGGTE